MEEKNPIQVADRLFGVLEQLAENGPMGLMEITKEVNLNKSTVHRVLLSLQCMGYVKQREEDSKYELTLKIVELSNKIMGRIDIIGKVRIYLRELMHKTGETVHFVKLEGIDAVYIDKVEARHNSIQMVSRIGSKIPFYCSGVGKAMAADMSEDAVYRMWEKSVIQQRTAHTIITYETFLQILSEIRQTGYAKDDEENELGVRCVAVSLDIPDGQERYAISISAPVARMEKERMAMLASELLNTKQMIRKEFLVLGDIE
ncbi:MAG: IclR family transcriptional regulator [Lachnospiraceae bacterium]